MPKKSPYDAGSMESAINDVTNNKLGLRATAKKYGVPKSTLEFKVKNPGHKETCGPSPILTFREESQLEKWIEELANRGFPRKKEDILNSVQQFLIENPRPNPFTNNRPGDRWFKAFLRRHPTIVQRTSEAVSAASACVSEADIRKWFDEIKSYFTSKNINLNDPSVIYNGDETGFQICPNTGKVFAGKGVKNVYSIDKGSQKENITVMFSFSASGMTCPPMVIYPYKRIPEKIAVTVNSDWGIGRSDNGWMISETFYDYIKNIFHPHLIKNHVKFPVILFLDGHKSHLTYELSLLCNELNIEVIALYPNATRILQPCDVAVFRPIKLGWKKAVKEFYEQNPGQVLNKISFAPLLEKVVRAVIKPGTLTNGFRACGLFPFNPDNIDYSKCLGKNNKLVEVTHADPVTMDDKTFTSFIGDNLIAKFKSYDAILIKEGFNDEFLALHQMWNYFGKPNNKVESNTNPTIDDESKKELEEFNSKKPVIKSKELERFPDNVEILRNNVQNSSLEVDLISTAEHADTKKVHVIANVIIRQGGNVAEVSASPKSNETFISTNLSGTANLSSINKNGENTNQSQKFDILLNKNIDHTMTRASSLPSTSKRIDEYLEIPDKPQRKNKRQIERVSFAITSRLYQQNFEAKRALKLEGENRKLERKRQRTEKAADKVNSKKVRKSKKAKEELICFMCLKRLTLKSQYLRCDSCKNCFHLLCIPKNHKKHVPDFEDDDLFMCHNCYEEGSYETVSDENFEAFENEEGNFRRDRRYQNAKSDEKFTNNNLIDKKQEGQKLDHKEEQKQGDRQIIDDKEKPEQNGRQNIYEKEKQNQEETQKNDDNKEQKQEGRHKIDNKEEQKQEEREKTDEKENQKQDERQKTDDKEEQNPEERQKINDNEEQELDDLYNMYKDEYAKYY